MHPKCFRKILIFISLFWVFSLPAGCSGKGSEEHKGDGTRPNTPVVYTPEAPGTELVGTDPLIVDISNKSKGYIMALYTGSSSKANIQLTGPDGVTYKYFFTSSDRYVPLPVTAGSGSYQIGGYENISENKYAVLFTKSLDIELENEFFPFLYPNQYVYFTPDTQAVSTASDVTSEASDDLDAVADIYHFVISNVVYDYEKAETVQSGYLPDVDETLASGKGICFDFAALTAVMLRSQNIPTRLEIGYSGDVYHAWISVYTEETGWIDDIIEFSSDGWTRMDPTFAAGNENSKKILKYIGNGSNYTTMYTR